MFKALGCVLDLGDLMMSSCHVYKFGTDLFAFFGGTLPETNSKRTWKWMVGILVTRFLLGWPIFRGYASLRNLEHWFVHNPRVKVHNPGRRLRPKLTPSKCGGVPFGDKMFQEVEGFWNEDLLIRHQIWTFHRTNVMITSSRWKFVFMLLQPLFCSFSLGIRIMTLWWCQSESAFFPFAKSGLMEGL